MAQQITDRRDVDFVLYEQFNAEELTTTERYVDMNRKMFDMVITEARNLSIKEILPVNEDADKTGLRFENNKVIVPQSFHRPWQLLKKGEWIAMTEDPEVGGQGIPHLINSVVSEYIGGSGFSMICFLGTSHGAH